MMPTDTDTDSIASAILKGCQLVASAIQWGFGMVVLAQLLTSVKYGDHAQASFDRLWAAAEAVTDPGERGSGVVVQEVDTDAD